MGLTPRRPLSQPVSVAIVAALTVAVVYGIITAWWIVAGNGEPSGGWGLHLTSAALQVAGWSFLGLLVAQLVAWLHRKMRPPEVGAKESDHPHSITPG